MDEEVLAKQAIPPVQTKETEQLITAIPHSKVPQQKYPIALFFLLRLHFDMFNDIVSALRYTIT